MSGDGGATDSAGRDAGFGHGGAATADTPGRGLRPQRLTPGVRGTQRERLLRAMTTVAAREGYAAASIAKVIGEAQVSRPTFYDYFTDKDDCFLQAQRAAAGVLLERVRMGVAAEVPARAPQALVRALCSFAADGAEQARLLVCELPAGGPRSLDVRDGLVEDLTALVRARRRDMPAGEVTPDLPLTALAGGLLWLLAPRVRRGEDPAGLAGELERWVWSFARPVGEHRWGELVAGPAPPPSRFVSELAQSAPAPLGPGRPGVSREEVARNQRERILYATAHVAAERGYNAATIGEIAARARVDARVFGAHFADKEQAFLAAHELGFQHIMAVAAGAFFTGSSWPERAWEGILAGTRFQATHPDVSHMLYVQSYAIGAGAIERIDQTHAAFTIFLQEGNQHAARPVSPLAMEAIVAASFDIAYQLSRRKQGEAVVRLAPHMAYLCLAPFLGPAAAQKLIDARMTV